MKKIYLLTAIILLARITTHAQGVAINTTGAPADASAILDANSTTQGFLPPRMTAAQKNAIANPANGLIVYQTDGVTGVYYNIGTPASPAWQLLAPKNPLGHGDSYSTIQQLLAPGITPLFFNGGAGSNINYDAYGLTISVPGVYHITYSLTCQNVFPNASSIAAAIYRNGTAQNPSLSGNIAGSATTLFSGELILTLNAGDDITIEGSSPGLVEVNSCALFATQL